VAEGEYGLLFTDGAKFGRAEQLHVALQVRSMIGSLIFIKTGGDL
jgi:hypothetical protein